MFLFNKSKTSNQKNTIAKTEREETNHVMGVQIFIYIILPILFLIIKVKKTLFETNIPWDTLNGYIPIADKFLKNTDTFFSNPESLTYAPGTYIFMALHGMQIDAIKITNLCLSILCIILVFDIGRRLHSVLAGGACAWLFAVAPTLKFYHVTPQSEPIFIFFVLLWIWSMIMAFGDPEHPIYVDGKYSRLHYVFLAGVALSIATLTRATYIFWIPTLLLTSLTGYFILGKKFKLICFKILLIHLISACLIGAYVMHNKMLFGKANVANGTGISLYLGNNPITHGYEPPYFGLPYDEWTVTQGQTHLNINNDHRLTEVSKLMLMDTSLPVLADMYVQKMGAFLFFSRITLDRQFFNDRLWRIFLLFFGAIGLYQHKKSVAIIFIFSVTCYQVAVHLPVQYTPRYSIGSIETFLIILAGIGLATFIQANNNRLKKFIILIGFMGAAIFGFYLQHKSAPLFLNLDAGKHQLIRKITSDELQTEGLSGNPFRNEAYFLKNTATIKSKSPDFNPNLLDVFKINVDEIDSKCDSLLVSLFVNGNVTRSVAVDLNGIKNEQDIIYGIGFLGYAKSNGTLSFQFSCPIGSKIKLGYIEIYHASMGEYYSKYITP